MFLISLLNRVCDLTTEQAQASAGSVLLGGFFSTPAASGAGRFTVCMRLPATDLIITKHPLFISSGAMG